MTHRISMRAVRGLHGDGLRWAVEAKRFPLRGAALVCVVTMALGVAPVRAITITVASTADIAANDGQCTLREAIIAANTNTQSGAMPGECAAGVAGLDTIAFNIPGGGVQTIDPVSLLPAIADAVTIDGYTQPLASPNTNPLDAGINAVLLIELNQTAMGGLRINAAGTTIRGLVLNRGFNQIEVAASNVTIAGNFIGTNPAGTVGLGGPSLGITQTSGNNTLIGGPIAADRNLLAGDPGGAIAIQAGDGARIQGNYIGTDVTGTVSLSSASSQVGVIVSLDTTNTVISGNLISGNRGGGMDIRSSGGGLIQGNLIGTQRDGLSALGNGNFGGINLQDPGSGFEIEGFDVGGTSPGQGNTIAFNTTQGIGVTPRTIGSSILGNSIFSNSNTSNSGLGINLRGSVYIGPLANDPCDTDSVVGNRGQNYPVITSAAVAAGNVTIAGTLNSTASSTFRVEFFSNGSCDALGNGEGQTFLGFVDVTTAGNCNASFGPLVFPVPPGQAFFTATATDPGDNTSEFSACFPIGVPPTPGGSTPTPTPTPGGPTPTITPTPSGLELCDNCIDDDADTLVDRDDNECPTRADGGDSGLGDPKGRGKAVGKCGKVLAKSAQKLATTKLKLLQACTRLAFTCLQVKATDAGCPLKAQTGCAKGLAKLGAARAKLAKAVRAKCGEPTLSFADLTGDSGLGFAREAEVCGDRGVAALGSVDDVAACVAAVHECRAEALLGYQQPRAAELLVRAGRTVAIDAPCLGAGADGGGAGLAAPTGKRTAKCALALGKAGTKFANGEVKLVQTCAAAVGKCLQEKAADAKCLPKARRSCGKQLAKLTAPGKGLSAKLAATVAKSCGAAGLDTSNLTDATGLGFGTLAADCATLGVPALDGVAGIAACIERQHACRVEQMLESQTPRLRELLDLGEVTLPRG